MQDDAAGAYGFNFVRVFVDSGDWSRSDGVNGPPNGPQALSGAYVANVADFVSTMAASGCYTMLTLTDLPANEHFAAATGPPPAWCGYPHCGLMAPGFVTAWVAYARVLAGALRAALPGGDTSALLAWSMVNEGYFLTSALPFASSSLVVQTADGRAYNMSDARSRQACADGNMVAWAAASAAALRSGDPGTLVTAGLFTPAAVGKVRAVHAAARAAG